MGLAKTKISTLDDILATRVKMAWPYRIDFHPDSGVHTQWEPMKQWCEINCKGRWNVEGTHALYFQFDNDRDATMFMLKWK